MKCQIFYFRWDDQQKIKKKMGVVIDDEPKDQEEEDGSAIDQFSIEYSKSNRSKCKKCSIRIDKVIKKHKIK